MTVCGLCYFYLNYTLRLSTNAIHRRGLKDSEMRTSQEYNRPIPKSEDDGRCRRQDAPEVIPKYVAVTVFLVVVVLLSYILFKYIEYSIDSSSATS